MEPSNKKHRKKLLSCILALSILCALCLENLLIVHLMPENKSNDTRQIEFVTQKEKENWRIPLITLLSNLDPYGSYVEVRPDEEYRDDRYDYFPGGYGIALFDFNLDGVPEVVEMYLGGSGGLNVGKILDLYSGEELGIVPGNEGEWCVYYNTETLQYEIIGTYGINFGLDSPQRFVSCLSYDDAQKSFRETVLFHASHNLICENITDSQAEWSYHTESAFYLNDETVSSDTYFGEYDQFFYIRSRIPHTMMKIFEWNDVSSEDEEQYTRAEKMADALLKSKQTFISP